MSPVTTPTEEGDAIKCSNPFEEEETATATTAPTTPPTAERVLGPTEKADSVIPGPSSNPFDENVDENVDENNGVEVLEEEDRNSLEDSDGDDGEEDDDRESVLTLQTMGTAVDQEVKTNATARITSLRNIDSQRAKNALNEYESDHEFDGEDRDDMFTRRQSITREPSFISPSSAVFATEGSATISAKLPAMSPTGAKESPFSMNSYGIRVPKIKRGVVELQSQRMFRRWKKRYFHLERGSVIYFEPLHWYQEGEFDLAGLDIATELKPNDELALHKAVNNFIQVMPIIKPVVDKEGVPLVHTGWLEKKGQWFPTIRRRFFLLFDGMLSYYRCEWDIHPYIQQIRQEQATGKASAQKKIRPPRALGKFAITNYQFRADFEHGRVEITLYPSLASPSRRVLVVYCNDFMERDSWLRHFHAHADYIKAGGPV
eukprot:gene12919-9240_t